MKTTMKMIIGIVLLIFIVTTTATAGKIDPAVLNKALHKAISYPEFAKKQNIEGIVIINFTLDSDGNIQIKTTNESDVTLKDYVVNKLKSINIFALKETNDDELEVKEDEYNVKFVFKLECDFTI